jgi:hypothetical protein
MKLKSIHCDNTILLFQKLAMARKVVRLTENLVLDIALCCSWGIDSAVIV